MRAVDSPKKVTNVLNLSILVIGWTIELSFTTSVKRNVFVVMLVFLMLIYKKKWGGITALLLMPLLPAVATYWSVIMRGTDDSLALVLFSRPFAFAALGLFVVYAIDLEELLRVLEQKKLPANFVYGLLVVIHGIPNIKQEVLALSEASLLRGKRLYFWSPIFYLKTIVVSFAWRDQYAEAMYSRGYDEGGTRVYYQTYATSKIGLLGVSLLFILSNLIA